MNLKLNVDNLVKRFGSRELFHIERLQVSEGESLHLSGDNGAGKTTLMKIMAGLEKPCAGRVMVTPKVRRWWADPIHPEVIYLHQTPYVFEGSVEENVAYGLKVRRCRTETLKIKTREALTWSRLEHLAEQPAHSLSGGEKQRLALARAWILEPRLLFLDEPTANLDSYSVKTVVELVGKMQHCGVTVMISSHQNNGVTQLCTRHLHLENGRLHEIDCLKEPSLYVQH